MPLNELIEQAMALPLADRVAVAEALWASIDAELPDSNPEQAVAQAFRRDAELRSGQVPARNHDEVMQAARRVVGDRRV